MAGLLDKIDDRRSVLLMYLADELPAPDKAEVEERLAADAALRAELDLLTAEQASFMQAMESLDAASAPPLPNDAVIRRTDRLVRQWVTRRLANPRLGTLRRPLIPSWAYPLATAAAILFAVIVWGLNRHEQEIAKGLPPINPPADEVADDMPTTAPVAPVSDSVAAIQEMSDPEQKDLLDAYTAAGTAEELGEDSSNGQPSKLDQADRALASLSRSDNLDNLFVGLGDAENTDGSSTVREQTP